MKAYEQCTRFDRCAVNKCPLDSNYKQMLTNELDAERKCTLPRRKRMEIGAGFTDLVYGGLTAKEHSGLEQFGKLPQNSQKIAISPRNSDTHSGSGAQA